MSLPLVSLHPPSHGDVDLAADAPSPRPDWILLDFSAYVDSCRNATTASCKARDGVHDVHVTFFPAQPPRVSHFCVDCPGLGPRCFGEEPKILATDGKFVLLRIFIGPRYGIVRHDLHEYYIYCADCGPDGAPSLQLLPNPSPCIFHDDQVGLISRGTSYTIAGLRDDSSPLSGDLSDLGTYVVYLFNSEDKIWRPIPVSVPCKEECSDDDEEFLHETSKDCTVDASEIFPAPLELLKELPGKGGKPCETLETFHTGHPTLSLDDDDIVYFMAKVKQQEKKAWILAVDMNHRMLLQISEFGAERTFGLSYTYTQSRISKYLNMTPR
ncbi:hypothetical protein PR202_ga23271 [Eleusine coracana subsp. coracana]|uniref:DUF1618 domain-containing protein n=1 Tax=Eleusine coracana subsp. coracana TaxID=191504 RepID=A0AAV5D3T1_ELECO|nr:hypothetical protein PR202_ga23271 [Eleusine coracana subsp. coracana]